MAFKLTIKPSGHTCTVPERTTILAAALASGFTLPYGCRDGACGSCKGRVLEGSIDYGRAQESALSEKEKAAGLALFCCATPLSDVVIECREVAAARDIPIKTMPCRVQKIERLADDVIALYLKVPVNERLLFLAGQYIDFLLQDGRRRGFSLANAPHDEALLQVHVPLVARWHNPARTCSASVEGTRTSLGLSRPLTEISFSAARNRNKTEYFFLPRGAPGFPPRVKKR